MPLRRPRARSPRPLVLLPGQQTPISHKHTPAQHSYLAFPPSPTSLRAMPRTPLTPPSRLHLRTLLPSPPLSSRYANMAPPVPYPWIWRCHKCGSQYQLGVTRRCLHDGHLFCSVPPPAPTPVSSHDVEAEITMQGEPCSSSDAKRNQMRKAQRRRQKARQRRRAVGCGSEFDYTGWSDTNNWRAYVRFCRSENTVEKRRQNGDPEIVRERWTGHNCWTDCDFPSECLNRRAQAEIEKKQIEALFEKEKVVLGEREMEVKSRVPDNEDEERFDFKGKVMEIEEWERELQRQKLTEFEKAEREMEEKFAVAVYGNSDSSSSSSSVTYSYSSATTISPSQSSSASGTEQIDDSLRVPRSSFVVDMERRGLEGEAQQVDVGLGPISRSTSSNDLELDDEELFGSEFSKKYRKKSIQKIAQLTGLMLGVEPVERGYDEEKPTSPLKEGFTFGDENWDDACPADRDREKEIVEEERSGAGFRRRVEKGEVEEFGDEEEL